MINKDLKKLRELMWEAFKVREEIKDKRIRYELGKMLNIIIDVINERERELVFKILEEGSKKDEASIKRY